jgi:hypothetical protein
MKHSKLILGLLVVLMITVCLPAAAQRGSEKPRLSPNAVVSQTVGVTVIEIQYGRPAVKEREIWGGLVPFDKVWRSGANEATTISFSTDVTINGQKLAAGTYGFFTIPTAGEWTVIFNSVSKQWGSMAYDASQDVLQIKVTPAEADMREWLQYSFEKLTSNSADVMFRWHKLALAFTVAVE